MESSLRGTASLPGAMESTSKTGLGIFMGDSVSALSDTIVSQSPLEGRD